MGVCDQVPNQEMFRLFFRKNNYQFVDFSALIMPKNLIVGKPDMIPGPIKLVAMCGKQRVRVIK